MPRPVRVGSFTYDEDHLRILINLEHVGLANPHSQEYMTREQVYTLVRAGIAVLEKDENYRKARAKNLRGNGA